MQFVEQITESISTLELKMSMILNEIDMLTREIKVHRETAGQSPGQIAVNKAMNEWRRRSFELHRLRSEMKSARDLLMSDIFSIRTLLEQELAHDNDKLMAA